MNKQQITAICTQVRKAAGINICGSMNVSGQRKGLLFWFGGYSRSNGPVFSINPAGLKRHISTLTFGPYAEACIRHISENASKEAYQLAYALVGQLGKSFEVQVNNDPDCRDWQITSVFQVKVVRKTADPQSDDSLSETVRLVMLPLMAAMAELIGYEEENENVELGGGREDGSVTISLVKRRERNPRNRILCLSVHGEKCGVCGFVPKELYGPDHGLILEVHHIEPLSEAGEPRVYNPITDLIPLCPNCHRAIHTAKPALSPKVLNGKLHI